MKSLFTITELQVTLEAKRGSNRVDLRLAILSTWHRLALLSSLRLFIVDLKRPSTRSKAISRAYFISKTIENTELECCIVKCRQKNDCNEYQYHDCPRVRDESRATKMSTQSSRRLPKNARALIEREGEVLAKATLLRVRFM